MSQKIRWRSTYAMFTVYTPYVHSIHPLTCELCSKSFVNRRILNGHTKFCTGSAVKKAFQCHICHIEFKRANSLKYHERYKHGLFPLSISISSSKQSLTCKAFREQQEDDGNNNDGLSTINEADIEDSYTNTR